MNSTALGQVGTCGGPWEGPAPPKPGCVLINLGSPLDAAVIFLSHVPFILGLPLASLCCGSLPPPTVQEGCACPKTSYDLWDALGKHLDGAGSAGLGLCFLALEATAGTGSPSLRHRSTIQRRDTFMLLPILAFLHPANSGHTVLGSYQMKRVLPPPPGLM